MSNEMIYQIKIDRIAPQALRKKIISIEDFGEAPTYDVEMAEPDHNFATETIVCHWIACTALGSKLIIRLSSTRFS